MISSLGRGQLKNRIVARHRNSKYINPNYSRFAVESLFENFVSATDYGFKFPLDFFEALQLTRIGQMHLPPSFFGFIFF